MDVQFFTVIPDKYLTKLSDKSQGFTQHHRKDLKTTKTIVSDQENHINSVYNTLY